MKTLNPWAAAIVTATLLSPTALFAVTIGQTDNFEDGTTQNWVINLLGMGSPPPSTFPTNVTTGGPSGAGDNYLLLNSSGNPGPGGRLVAINFNNQWKGNYIAAGVNALTMNVNNFGSTTLSLRLEFADPVAGPPADQAVSTTPVLVPAGSGWRTVLFPIDPSFLTAETGNVIAALTNATELRILNSPTLGVVPQVAASLGVDNITAASIPEPATSICLALGLASLLSTKVRRNRE